jgi:hypothetical protein
MAEDLNAMFAAAEKAVANGLDKYAGTGQGLRGIIFTAMDEFRKANKSKTYRRAALVRYLLTLKPVQAGLIATAERVIGFGKQDAMQRLNNHLGQWSKKRGCKEGGARGTTTVTL